MVDKYCIGCYFRTTSSRLGNTCDYILITDHMRPCGSGEGCTVKLEKKGEGTAEERRLNYLRSRQQTEADIKAEQERKLDEKRAYQREWYKKNRERNLAQQKVRRDRAKEERAAKGGPVEDWRSRKAHTAAITRERWQGRQTEAIMSWKEQHGLTYAQMGEMLGVKFSTVAKWANEENNADWDRLAKLGIKKPEEPVKLKNPQ